MVQMGRMVSKAVRQMLSWLRAKPLPENADCSRAIAKMKRRSSIPGVTYAGKTDGGGAQIHAVMSAILFADAIGSNQSSKR